MTLQRIVRLLVAIGGTLTSIGWLWGNDYAPLRLYALVQGSDVIVVGRIADPSRALVHVQQVLKGNVATEVTLTKYVDGMMRRDQQKPLVVGTRELLFLKKDDDAYAPLQEQFGRLPVVEDRVAFSFPKEVRSLSATVTTIQRLVTLQARAARSDAEATAAYLDGLKDSDTDLQTWALWTAKDRIKIPVPALVDAMLARWRAPHAGSEAAGTIANTMVTWRVQRTAPFFAHILTASQDGDERGWAAMALGGSADVTFLPLLRDIATNDQNASTRAFAYNGLMYMLGPGSLDDLRRGAKDANEHVRARCVVDSYNLLELERSERRWSPASDALIAQVRAFLIEMQRDPVPLVHTNARSMLALIARHRP